MTPRKIRCRCGRYLGKAQPGVDYPPLLLFCPRCRDVGVEISATGIHVKTRHADVIDTLPEVAQESA